MASKASNSIHASWHPWPVREPLRVEMFIVLSDEHRNESKIALYIPGFRRFRFSSHWKYASGEDGVVLWENVVELFFLITVDNIQLFQNCLPQQELPADPSMHMLGWVVDFRAALWIVGRILPSVQVCSEPSF